MVIHFRAKNQIIKKKNMSIFIYSDFKRSTKIILDITFFRPRFYLREKGIVPFWNAPKNLPFLWLFALNSPVRRPRFHPLEKSCSSGWNCCKAPVGNTFKGLHSIFFWKNDSHLHVTHGENWPFKKEDFHLKWNKNIFRWVLCYFTGFLVSRGVKCEMYVYL